MNVTPYINFNGRCQEALDFYSAAIGAEIFFITYFRDCPDKACIPPGAEDKVMHATVNIGNSTIMASDGCGNENPAFSNISLSVCPADEAEARKLFDALAEGGEVSMPLNKTFWSPCFGILKDRFGLSWMINVEEDYG